jgi:hypothetical protein
MAAGLGWEFACSKQTSSLTKNDGTPAGRMERRGPREKLCARVKGGAAWARMAGAAAVAWRCVRGGLAASQQARAPRLQRPLQAA